LKSHNFWGMTTALRHDHCFSDQRQFRCLPSENVAVVMSSLPSAHTTSLYTSPDPSLRLMPYFPPGQRNEPSSLFCSPSEARQHSAFAGTTSHQALGRRQALMRPEMTTPPAPSRAADPPIPPSPPTSYVCPSRRRAGGRRGRGHGAGGCIGTGEPPHRRSCFPH